MTGWVTVWAIGAIALFAWLTIETADDTHAEPVAGATLALCLLWPVFLTAVILLKVQRWWEDAE